MEKATESHLINDTTANTNLVSCLGKYCVHIVLIMLLAAYFGEPQFILALQLKSPECEELKQSFNKLYKTLGYWPNKHQVKNEKTEKMYTKEKCDPCYDPKKIKSCVGILI